MYRNGPRACCGRTPHPSHSHSMSDSYPPVPSHPLPGPDWLVEVPPMTVGLPAVVADPVCRRVGLTGIHGGTRGRSTAATRASVPRGTVGRTCHVVRAWDTGPGKRDAGHPVVVPASLADEPPCVGPCRCDRRKKCCQHARKKNRASHFPALSSVSGPGPSTAVTVHCLRRIRGRNIQRRT